ncbi:hypothetical protein [Mesorhizobium sp. M0195]
MATATDCIFGGFSACFLSSEIRVKPRLQSSPVFACAASISARQ